MSSKEQILAKIKALGIKPRPLPIIPEFATSWNLEEVFTQSILLNKGTVTTREQLTMRLKTFPYEQVYSAVEEFSEYSSIHLPEDPHALESLDLAIIKGKFAVAENGAIWMDDTTLGLRVLPFIASHLVVLVDSGELVATMHQAYDKIGSEKSGFGLFIAGPSKTADIEQSLVIGAQGAKSLEVLLI